MNTSIHRGMVSSSHCKVPQKFNDKKRGILARGELYRRRMHAAMSNEERKEKATQAENRQAVKDSKTRKNQSERSFFGNVANAIMGMFGRRRG